MATSSLIWITISIILLLVIFLIVLPLVFVRYKAVKYGKKEVNLFNGWMKLVLWQPKEAVVILKNKKVVFVDEKGEGGIKFIYPIIGEELKERVPLGIQMLTWEDDKVLTRESLQIHMKVVVWWNISDTVKYVFDIDRSVQLSKERAGMGSLESSQAWLMALTEGTIRVLASKASTTQLVSSVTTGYLKVHNNDTTDRQEEESVQTISETIALQLNEELNRKVSEYGIHIDRVEIQAIRLSTEVQEAINKVWLAFLKPVQTEQEARARQIELQKTAEVLGTDTVALNELLKNFRGSDFTMMPSYLQTMFGMIDTKAQNLRNSNSGLDQINNEKTFLDENKEQDDS